MTQTIVGQREEATRRLGRGESLRAAAPAGVPGYARLHIAVLGLVFVAFFWNFFARQARASLDPDWSHAFVVPLVSLYFIYENRRRILAIPARRNWLGLPILLVGMLVYSVFALGPFPNHTMQGAAMILSLLGLVLFMLGGRLWMALLFPMLYLSLGVTVSPRVLGLFTPTLQHWAAVGSYFLLNIIGYDTDIAGNVLTVFHNGEALPLNVAEACSGMRMIVGFLALGVAIAFLSLRHWWQRVALILSALPVAILVNIVRVASIGLMSTLNRDWASGDAHLAIGMVWLVPAFGLYMGIVWILNRLVIEDDQAAPAAATRPGSTTKGGTPR